MFGSAALEVATGLVLVFLLMSLIMTVVQETLHGFFNTRARMLEKTLLEILQGDKATLDAFYNHPLIYALHRGTRDAGAVRSPRQLPSYIPRETFAAALLQLKEGKDAPPQLKQAVDSLKKVAGSDATALRREVEGWYDAAMDRVSGAFKRRSQASLFGLGLGAALLLNVNAIVIAQFLAVSPQQRQLVSAVAERTIGRQTGEGSQAQPTACRDDAASPGPAPVNSTAPAGPSAASPICNEQVNALTNQLLETGMPLGWNAVSQHWIERGFPDQRILLFQGSFSISAVFAWLLLIAGYLVTAFAVMLGAPFWFDTLNKIMVIRATVKPREKSPDEASEDRGGGRGTRRPA